MAQLVNEEGATIEDEDQIKQMVSTYMANLFKRQEETATKKEKRAKILDLIDKRVSREENNRMIEEPTAEEIGKLVRTMARGKAPGLISKLMADHIKALIPRLDDEEQTGFVEGRNIVDNIISLKLGQDIAEATKQATLFCKLDFVKAFDRIEHIYLWDTLEAMNFHPRFIQLLKRLIATGRSKVRVNGELTDSFPLERG
ncbi:hypothetical protein R1sor_002650 [Riccia sorocarpa]|uniref:Reverse transcriptase domain-containing protein n=1 Tax=Riccia sorocarpa TaxID=122646 RepID=A0ABD3GZS4_9MARC